MDPNYSFRKSPFLYLLLAFVLGIIAVPFLSTWLSILRNLLLAALLVGFAYPTFLLKRTTISWVFALLALTLLGALSTRLKTEIRPANHIDRLFQSQLLNKDTKVEIIGYLYEDPEIYTDKIVVGVRLERIRIRDQESVVSGNVRISIHSGSSPPEGFFPQGLHYGDRIRTLVVLRKPRNFQNPGSFDYVRYLQINEIDAIGSLKAPELVDRLGGNAGQFLLRQVLALRRVIAKQIKDYFTTTETHDSRQKKDPLHNQEAAAILALFLGDRILLHANVEESFKRTGVYHVLVVSGAHVAILAFILFQILNCFSIPEWFKGTFVIAAIVFYTLLIGVQPSVLRASVMIITYLLGRIIYREGNFLNSVSLAAFVLLVFNPLWLYDIGFQLSFAAVYAICLIGVPLGNVLIKPHYIGLSMVFSDRLLTAQTSAERRARLTRFMAELLIEARMNRFPYLSKKLWAKLAHLVGKLFYDLCSLLLITIAIEIVLLALMIPYFNRVVMVSPILNLLIVPLSSLILFLTLLFISLAVFSKALAVVFARLLKLFTRWMLLIVTISGDFKFAQYRIPTPPRWIVVGFLGSLTLSLVIQKKHWRRVLIPVFFGFVILISTYPFRPHLNKEELSMTVLDVGQGDSLYVQFPRGSTLLIDGGGVATPSLYSTGSPNLRDGWERHFDIGEQVISPFLWSLGLKRLTYVALTHAHHDHISGLLSVVDNFEIGRALLGRNPPDYPEYNELMRRLKTHRIPDLELRRNDKLEIDGVTLEILNPIDNTPPPRVSNDDSLAIRLIYKNVAFLLTGDIEKKVELDLLGDCVKIRSQILKVPHHGSKSSSTEEFLNCVQPHTAIISAGSDNPFGHPHPEIVERYRSRGIRLYQTHVDGAVKVATDGDHVWLTKFTKN